MQQLKTVTYSSFFGARTQKNPSGYHKKSGSQLLIRNQFSQSCYTKTFHCLDLSAISNIFPCTKTQTVYCPGFAQTYSSRRRKKSKQMGSCGLVSGQQLYGCSVKSSASPNRHIEADSVKRRGGSFYSLGSRSARSRTPLARDNGTSREIDCEADVEQEKYPFLILFPYFTAPLALSKPPASENRGAATDRFWIRGASPAYVFNDLLATLVRELGVHSIMPEAKAHVAEFCQMLSKGKI